MPPTTEEEAVLPGDDQEPQEAQEVTTSSPECSEATEPEGLTEWADAPSQPTPSLMASNSQGNWSWNTRTAQHRA